MNCRINLRDKLTKKEKDITKEFIRLETSNLIRRYFKLICVTLNEDFGFGKQRLLKIIDTIDKLSTEHQTDEVFWEHVDKRVIEQIGVEFEYEKY